MTYLHHDARMEFNLEGQFLDFVKRHGKLKYLRLQVQSEEIRIKLSKAVRLAGNLAFQPGQLIRVVGQGKLDQQTQELKLKALQVLPLAGLNPASGLPCGAQPAASKSKSKIKLLVCKKSGCSKRGKGLWDRLDQILQEHNLDQHVTIEQTGCLKRCSSSPNLVIMPGKHQYKDVCPKMLPKIAATIAQKVTC
jgi:(2Fe-2S) ferredoxin